MPDKEKFIVLAIAVALIGTASLYIYTARRDVERVDIADIDHDFAGMKVEVEGYINEVRGLQSIYLLNLLGEKKDETLSVVIEEQVMGSIEEQNEIMPGANVRVRGVVELYENEVSLRVTVPGELIILEEAYSKFTSISSLLENPEWYSGMEVKVRGKVTDLETIRSGTYFEIEQLEGGYHRLGCFVEDIDLSEDFYMVSGDPVVFKGTFLYDTSTGRWLVRGLEPPDVRTIG